MIFLHVSHFAMRGLVVCAVVTAVSSAQAGTLLGGASGPGNAGNDKEVNVEAVIAAYNVTHATTLPEDITLFKKTDDDAVFVFNAANGFTFWDAAVGGTQLTTEAALTSTQSAWFEYTGSASILYYSTKAATAFEVVTFMPGVRNPLVVGTGDHDISHASFWVPEPGIAVAMLAGCSVLSLRRRNLG